MIPFVREFEFEYGRVDQVSPLIRRVVANNPGPFTFTGTGTYIVGRGQVAVIDPGPDMPEHLEALTQALEGERVEAILLTHHHADHSPLAGALKARTGGKIHGCPPSVLAGGAPVKVDSDPDPSFAPDVTVCGGGVIAGPGWTLEAIPTPGHTANHVCYALAEENVLFSGDHIMGWSTTVIAPPDGDMGAYYGSLQRIAARNFDILWPTHGPPIREPEPFIAAYAAHRRTREAQILAALSESALRPQEIVPMVYDGLDVRLYPAAAMSVLAHLIHLEQAGLATLNGDGWVRKHT